MERTRNIRNVKIADTENIRNIDTKNIKSIGNVDMDKKNNKEIEKLDKKKNPTDEISKMTVNPLPAKTWYWLNMNASEVNLSDFSKTTTATNIPAVENSVNSSKEVQKQYIAYPTVNSLSEKNLIKDTGFTFLPANEEEEKLFSNIETGMGEDMNSFMEKVPAHMLKNETDEKQMAVFDLAALTGSKAVYKLYIYAKKDSETEVSILNSNIVDALGEDFYKTDTYETECKYDGKYKTKPDKTVSNSRYGKTQQADIQHLDVEQTSVVNVKNEKNSYGLSSIQIKIYAEENAKVHLSMAQILEKSEISFWDIGGELKENASVEIIKLEAGSKKAYTGTLMNLSGTKSSFDAQVGYYGKDKQKLDMNYVARHTGKKTISNMETNGVLEDGAFKLFRGSIDFKPGCSGAKGDEKEEVLLLGDDVVNQTIPLILCSEEDVEGNHGASIGNLDEKTMFYLKSRGFSEKAAQNMVARARIDSICEKISDGYVREKVEEKLDTI